MSEEIDYSRYYVKNRHTYNDVMANEGGEHHIEYIEKEKDKKGKKRRRKDTSRTKHSVKGTLLTIAIIVTIFLLTIVLADSIRGGYVLSTLKTIVLGGKEVATRYYAVECRTYEDIESARIYSNEIRLKQGAGYVISDEGYRVLVEVYSSKDDATEIAKKLRLEGENARVYEFDIKRIDYLKFPEKTRNAVKSALEFNDRVYRDLYSIGLDLARGNIDENSARMRVKGLYNETHNILTEFESNVDSETSNENIVKVKAELVSIEATLLNLASNTVKRPNLLADIRYTSCLIVNAYRELSCELT